MLHWQIRNFGPKLARYWLARRSRRCDGGAPRGQGGGTGSVSVQGL